MIGLWVTVIMLLIAIPLVLAGWKLRGVSEKFKNRGSKEK